MTRLIWVVLYLMIFAFTSCTVQDRLYQPGLYIDRKGGLGFQRNSNTHMCELPKSNVTLLQTPDHRVHTDSSRSISEMELVNRQTTNIDTSKVINIPKLELKKSALRGSLMRDLVQIENSSPNSIMSSIYSNKQNCNHQEDGSICYKYLFYH
jgi:hypothetical protein